MPIKPWKVLETNYFRSRFRIDKCELPNGNLLDATIFEFRIVGKRRCTDEKQRSCYGEAIPSWNL